ncbi:MAG: hypothetical protein WDA08_01430 [Weeksellaceae bacterium]
MNFLNKLFNSKEKKIKEKDNKESQFNQKDRGVIFDINAFPKEHRNRGFYFSKYFKSDGEWINEKQPVCEIRIGEFLGSICDSATILADTSGYLEFILKENDLLNDGTIVLAP